MILLFFVWYKKYMFWKWILWIPFLWISSTYLTGNSIIFQVTAQESYMSIKYQPWENKNNGNFMVSIHRIPFIVYLTIRVISCIFRFKRGTSLLSVPQIEALALSCRFSYMSHRRLTGTTLSSQSRYGLSWFYIS